MLCMHAEGDAHFFATHSESIHSEEGEHSSIETSLRSCEIEESDCIDVRVEVDAVAPLAGPRLVVTPPSEHLLFNGLLFRLSDVFDAPSLTSSSNLSSASAELPQAISVGIAEQIQLRI